MICFKSLTGRNIYIWRSRENFQHAMTVSFQDCLFELFSIFFDPFFFYFFKPGGERPEMGRTRVTD